MNTGCLLHAGALLLRFRRNFDMCGEIGLLMAGFPSRELLCGDWSHVVQARRQRGTALAVRKWLLDTKWIQICNYYYFIASGEHQLSLAFRRTPFHKSKYFVVKVRLRKRVNIDVAAICCSSGAQVMFWALQCAVNAEDVWLQSGLL